jgi:hypothetical protein
MAAGIRDTTMREAATALFITAMLAPSLASAQFGILNYPNEDFIWRWANARDAEPRLGPEDFEARGQEATFDCVLTGALSPGSHVTDLELKEMEYQLQSSLFFIQASAELMNELELQREIAWATLDCKKPQPSEQDAAELEEEVERARQKAVEEMLRRRERSQR